MILIKAPVYSASVEETLTSLFLRHIEVSPAQAVEFRIAYVYDLAFKDLHSRYVPENTARNCGICDAVILFSKMSHLLLRILLFDKHFISHDALEHKTG